MTGPIFADIFTIDGFSFFGKNIFNTLPIYLGIYLFARIQKLPFRSFIIVVLFSTGISPLVSFMIFGTGWPLYLGIPIGIISGMLAGFVLPAFSAHTIRFHRGYNLYNKLILERPKIAKFNKLKAFEVYSDQVAKNLSKMKPKKIEDLDRIFGFDKKNIEIFGAYLVNFISKNTK